MSTSDPMGTGDTEQQPKDTNELLQLLIEQQQAQREEMAALRAEVAAARKQAPPSQPAQRLSPEELLALRMADINLHSHYCPGCGALYDRPRECVGKGEAPHPAIEVVSTDELKTGDESKYTPAPATVNLG